MLRNNAKLLEKALIMEDRLDYANYILDEERAQELFDQLKFYLDSEETTYNIQQLQKFVELFEEEIHQFDIMALDETSRQEEKEREIKWKLSQ